MRAKAFKITQAAWLLHELGIRHHASGVLKDGKTGARLFDYYSTDSVSDAQRAALLAKAPDVQFYTSGPSYAPEIRVKTICFPKAAWYRKQQEPRHANP